MSTADLALPVQAAAGWYAPIRRLRSNNPGVFKIINGIIKKIKNVLDFSEHTLYIAFRRYCSIWKGANLRMADQRMAVLESVARGELSVEQAVKRLNRPRPMVEGGQLPCRARWIRIRFYQEGASKFGLTLPWVLASAMIGLCSWAIRLLPRDARSSLREGIPGGEETLRGLLRELQRAPAGTTIEAGDDDGGVLVSLY